MPPTTTLPLPLAKLTQSSKVLMLLLPSTSRSASSAASRPTWVKSLYVQPGFACSGVVRNDPDVAEMS
jgi:hypothetical protein